MRRQLLSGNFVIDIVVEGCVNDERDETHRCARTRSRELERSSHFGEAVGIWENNLTHLVTSVVACTTENVCSVSGMSRPLLPVVARRPAIQPSLSLITLSSSNIRSRTAIRMNLPPISIVSQNNPQRKQLTV